MEIGAVGSQNHNYAEIPKKVEKILHRSKKNLKQK